MSDIVPADGNASHPGPRRRLAVAAALVGALAVAALLLFFVGGTSDDQKLADASASRDERPSASVEDQLLQRDEDEVAVPSSTTIAPAAATSSSSAGSDLEAATRTAEDFIAAAQARDCARVLAVLSANSLAWLDSQVEDGKSGRDVLCEGLATEDIPPMSIRTAARAVPGGAIVELESEGDVEPLALVLESGSWKVDLIGTGQAATQEYAASTKQGDLRNALTAERVIYTDEQRYTDDVVKLEEVEPSLVWKRGMATADGDRSIVYVAIADDGQVVCLSGVDHEGVRYMIKDSPRDGVTYAKGEATPPVCDAAPLGDSW